MWSTGKPLDNPYGVRHRHRARGRKSGLSDTLSSHPVVGATAAASPSPTDLMSTNEQVFWLRGHPFDFAFPLDQQWPSKSIVSRYSGATAQDFHLLPYSPQAVAWNTHSQTHILYMASLLSAAYYMQEVIGKTSSDRASSAWSPRSQS